VLHRLEHPRQSDSHSNEQAVKNVPDPFFFSDDPKSRPALIVSPHARNEFANSVLAAHPPSKTHLTPFIFPQKCT
jgi:mRNA-degrading endonuclease toxin of MazEF toxin-antitoxin module